MDESLIIISPSKMADLLAVRHCCRLSETVIGIISARKAEKTRAQYFNSEVVIVETATVVEDGRSQTIRLPNKIHLKSTDVVVKQLGDAVLIVPRVSLWQTFLDGVYGFTDDFFEDGRDQGFQEDRDWS